jgi:glycosyltransferase involved in cell wall biosynthesis
MQSLKIVMIGAFGMHPRMTMRVRALPLAKALVARGHAVTMLLPPWQNPEDAGRHWTEEGVRIENAVLPHKAPGWFHWRLTAHLVNRARELQPDVIHAFKPKAYAGLAHLALTQRYPVVVDTDDWEGPGGWNAIGGYSPGLQRFFTWQERWGLAHAGAVTAASRALQTLVWSMGGSPERVFYLPNGASAPVGQGQASPGPQAPAEKRPTVLLYTRFFEYDLDRLWRLMRAVRARRRQVRFLVVGKGFAAEEERLLEMARSDEWRVVRTQEYLPDADLVYVGWGTGDNLSRCFAAADIAIYPFDDTLLNRTKCPVKLMDLLAAGIPVVGDAVGQIAEAIVPGKTGVLVPVGHEHEFVEAVLGLLKAPEALTVMREAALRDMADRYAWAGLSQVAETAYRHAILSRANRKVRGL